MDALNVLNHPVFSVYPNNGGGADFMGAPSTATLTTAAFNTWATANSQPSCSGSCNGTDTGSQIYQGILSMVNAQKLVSGALPADFYRVPLPSNFYGTAATSYDIRTLSGYKYYQLRNAYSTSFGDLYQSGSSRYIQFGVRLFF